MCTALARTNTPDATTRYALVNRAPLKTPVIVSEPAHGFESLPGGTVSTRYVAGAPSCYCSQHVNDAEDVSSRARS